MENRVCVVGIIKKGDSILLGRKAPGKGPYPDTWHIPGGGIKLGEETCEQAISREILEETGISVKNLKKVGWSTDIEPNKHGVETYYIFLIYEAEYDSGELQANDDLIHIEWVKISELKTKNLNRPTEKYFKSLGFI